MLLRGEQQLAAHLERESRLLYVVYGDARDTLSEPRPPRIVTRNFVVKFTRLFRF